MGSRVRKFLGYGLTDIQTEDMKIIDPRINASSWALTREGEPSPAEYKEWLAGHDSQWPTMDYGYLRHPAPDAKPRALGHCFVWSPEFGLPEVLAIQPLSCTDWARFDDPIDYAQETWLEPESQANRVQVMPAGPYPFVGTYTDARTGERLPDAIMWWIRAHNDARDIPQEVMDGLAREGGIGSDAEAREFAVPVVPDDVRNLAEFAELFTGDTVWRQLRPLLYTYWS